MQNMYRSKKVPDAFNSSAPSKTIKYARFSEDWIKAGDP